MKGIPESGYYMKLVMIMKAEICLLIGRTNSVWNILTLFWILEWSNLGSCLWWLTEIWVGSTRFSARIWHSNRFSAGDNDALGTLSSDFGYANLIDLWRGRRWRIYSLRFEIFIRPTWNIYCENNVIFCLCWNCSLIIISKKFTCNQVLGYTLYEISHWTSKRGGESSICHNPNSTSFRAD